MSDVNSNSESKRIEELTISQLISTLRVSHLWGMVGAIATIIAISFGVGYKVADIQSSKATSSAIVSENEHEFVTRYLRYMVAREISYKDGNEISYQKFQTAKSMFVDLISKWWKDQQGFDGKIVLGPRIIRKGLDPTDSQVIFADNTTWPIPPEIKEEVLKR